MLGVSWDAGERPTATDRQPGREQGLKTFGRLARPVRVRAWLEILTIVGLTLIYAACYALINAGLAFAPPLRFAGLRALIGGVALLSVAWAMAAQSRQRGGTGAASWRWVSWLPRPASRGCS